MTRVRRALVTNDDGVGAPGIEVAEAIARTVADEVWTVAPEGDYSGGSRQLTLHHALRLHHCGGRRYALNGSPADCVFVALGALLKDSPPDLVISGVNAGVNIGGDVGFSGTVGAAMSARLLGVPAIALSQAWKGSRADIPWTTSRSWLPGVLAQLIETEAWPWRFVPNVNVPATGPEEVSGIVVTRQGRSATVTPFVEHRVDLRDQDYYWIYMKKVNDDPEPDEDIAALRRNAISITPLGYDVTDRGGFDILSGALNGTAG